MLSGIAIFCGAVFIVPILIAKFVLFAKRSTIGLAYTIWFGFLLLQIVIGATPAQWSDALGWMTILAIYLSIPVIVVLVLLIHAARFTKGWMAAKRLRT